MTGATAGERESTPFAKEPGPQEASPSEVSRPAETGKNLAKPTSQIETQAATLRTAPPEAPKSEVVREHQPNPPNRTEQPRETSQTPARDIKLQLGGGERRVEVRLVERAGEVRVAVHTPDSRLAGDLRENLHSLASRLEQNGLRADDWRLAEPAAARPHLIETADGSFQNQFGKPPQQDSREHHGQQEPRRQPAPEEERHGKQRRDDFSWLLSDLSRNPL